MLGFIPFTNKKGDNRFAADQHIGSAEMRLAGHTKTRVRRVKREYWAITHMATKFLSVQVTVIRRLHWQDYVVREMKSKRGQGWTNQRSFCLVFVWPRLIPSSIYFSFITDSLSLPKLSFTTNLESGGTFLGSASHGAVVAGTLKEKMRREFFPLWINGSLGCVILR